MSHKQTPHENCAQILEARCSGLNPLEKNSVQALVAYTALNTGRPEEEIQRSLCTKFSAKNIDCLAPRSFDDAIRFLVDLCEEDEEPMEGGAMIIVDILSQDSSTGFATCQQMAIAIAATMKAKGTCKPKDLLEQNFSHAEIEHCWEMAQRFAHFEVSEAQDDND